jgi:hypothetical protein
MCVVTLGGVSLSYKSGWMAELAIAFTMGF